MKRRFQSASFALLLCWSAAGCGNGVDPEQAFTIALQKLTKAKTATVKFSLDAPGGTLEKGTLRARFGSETDMVIHFDGFEAPAPSQPTNPPIGGEPTRQPTPTVLTDVIVRDRTVYAKGTGVAPAGKQWGKSYRGANTATETAVDLLDPLTYLRMATKAKHVRPEKGVNVGDHPGTASMLDCDLENLDCDIDALGALAIAYPDTESIKIIIWLDGDEQPTFLEVTGNLANMSAPGGSAAFGHLDVQMSLSGLGDPVTVTAPPTEQVG